MKGHLLKMRVLGVDPGLTRCGLAIVDEAPGRKVILKTVMVFRTPATDALADRLLQLDTALSKIIKEYKPDVVAVEQVFSQHNLKSVMGTAQAAGLAMVNAAKQGCQVFTYTPTQVKASVTGSGKADKRQIGRMIAKICGLSSPPEPADASDAVALAICHLWRGGADEKIRKRAVS
ncbi:MAG: crossover junction endodeoxyribonuclease RuvC [Actinomycetes bacterium]